jgi:hypothetical protein
MTLAALRNALVRWVLFTAMRPVGHMLRWAVRRSLPGQADRQAALRGRYQIDRDTPIEGYTEALRERVRGSGHRIVTTSGSTAQPKELAYPRARTRMVRLLFARITLRCAAARQVKRPLIFTLSSLSEDGSLTAVMTGGTPSLVDCLMTPNRVLHHPAFEPIIARYGLMAVRVWAMVMSSPGWLYSTNPSTQAVFFHKLGQDWDGARAMLRDWLADPGQFSVDVQRQTRRMVAPGWRSRAEAAMAAEAAAPVRQWLPALAVFSSWDGGNTRPFLTQVQRALPAAEFIPMFSMSTETIETVTVFRGRQAHFLPIAPGVLYEFLPAAEDDDPAQLRSADALEVGEEYALVVSDAWGLRRYQTEDIFACVGTLDGLPDLQFCRRRGLTWSFTGEKLTSQHLEHAYRDLVRDFPMLDGVQLTTAPSHPEGDRLPGYHLVLAVPGGVLDVDRQTLAERFDQHLRTINEEYESKRASDRLKPPRASVIDYDTLAAAIRGGADVQARGWDSQFKLLPLLRTRWETLGLSGDTDQTAGH